MKLRFLALAMCAFSFAQAQNVQSAAEAEAAYLKVVTGRAAKIVEKIGLNDTAKFTRVCSIIAFQYRDLNAIHDERNAALATLKKDTVSTDKEAKIKAAENTADAKLYALHCAYVGKLLSELTPEQVEQVKDGMTYGVAPLTYRVHLEMIPTLTEAQKRYMWAALCEAREHAMDAESSEKKHWWFGKYKGRINNYLAKEGYDLKKERVEWGKREAAKKK
ncbi:MAG: DUF3826 domain-containing protein [Prevotellaceae bacterium]|jgi:hypothetical protein|nr:DUF3826 domain-containing protein [Prevotellaceae bacterium]